MDFKSIVEAVSRELSQRNFPGLATPPVVERDGPGNYWHYSRLSDHPGAGLACEMGDAPAFRIDLLWVGVSSSRSDRIDEFISRNGLEFEHALTDQDEDPDDDKYWSGKAIRKLLPLFERPLGPTSALIRERYHGEHYIGSYVVPSSFSPASAADLLEFLVGLQRPRSLESLNEQRDRDVQWSSEDRDARLERLKTAPRKPVRRERSIVDYDRNPDVVAERLYLAKGICGKCSKTGPFKRRGSNQLYLEVHHVIPLGDGGDDTVENTIALCPNCHRQEHFG